MTFWRASGMTNIRQPVQFPVENHNMHYLLSHRACARLSIAVISQMSMHTTLQLMINRISSLIIKVITRDTLWKVVESTALQFTLSLKYISAYFLAKALKASLLISVINRIFMGCISPSVNWLSSLDFKGGLH